MKTKLYISSAILFFGISLYGQSAKFETNFSDTASSLSNLDEINLIQLDSVKVRTKRDVPWFVERFKVSAGFFETKSHKGLRLF